MKFSILTKQIDGFARYPKSIECDLISAQYNPSRFKYWASSCDCNILDCLNMTHSPHVKLLLDYKIRGKKIWDDISSSNYFLMQKRYGKSEKWTRNKISSFIELFDSVQDVGVREMPIILPTPLVDNKYNKGYEIFEGHHRIACCISSEIVSVKCLLVNKNENI